MLKVQKIVPSEIVPSKTKCKMSMEVFAKYQDELREWFQKNHSEEAKLYPDISPNKKYKLVYEFYEAEDALKLQAESMKENNSTQMVMFLDSDCVSFKSFVELCLKEFDLSELSE